MSTKNYKLEGEAYEAAKQMLSSQIAFQKAMQAIQDESVSRMEYLQEMYSQNNKRLWTTIARSLDVDAERTYAAGSGVVTQFLEFGVAFAFVKDNTPDPDVAYKELGSPSTQTIQ